MHRFIVGTGRCGSTLLSRMLARNPATLSLFEFFNGLDGSRRFSSAPMRADAYAELISAEQPFLTWVYERGYDAPEVLYPFDAPGARFARSEGLPWILVSMLPALSDAPEALYDEVLKFVRERPEQSAPAHHLELFDWLTRRHGRRVWVERSGASIDYLGDLNDSFEGARFLHIHRVGEEAALSMREHHAFRLAIMLAYALPAGTGRGPDELRRLVETGREGDRIAELLASRPPAEYFGRWWTEQVRRGALAQARLEKGQLHEVRFEALLSRPLEVLAEVARFLELPDPDGAWREEAAALVRAAPAPRWAALPEAEASALAEACREGNELLGR